MGSNITTTSVLVDGAQLPGSSQARFRIIATDGVNTASDDSDGTFSVPDKTPIVQVTSPAEGAVYLPGQPVALTAMAIDQEDGTLPDARLSWTSSLSGTLGTGHLLHITDLMNGAHVITLTATDSAGNTAMAARTVHIGQVQMTVYLPIILRR